MDHLLIYNGKVRDIYKLGDHHLLLKASDRISSFDKHVGTVPGKGKLLNQMSKLWFEKTRHIIDNHLITTQDDVSLVHKCEPFKIEVIVRGYITGNTDTSLWTHYKEGKRKYCGNTLPDGLKKNQKLEKPIITPTTKGEKDEPISPVDIIEKKYMTSDECNYVMGKALELFDFGQKYASQKGLILVDTKYEFGKNTDGKIILIDELHTCDSSRYWIEKTYNSRFENNLEPEKLDKDIVRDWLRDNSKVNISKILSTNERNILEDQVINRVYQGYKIFYDTISSV